jgi:hypothetical protein
MSETDYGYGEQHDYGYGDAEPVMVDEDVKRGPDAESMYGYGKENDTTMMLNSGKNNDLDQVSTHVRRPKRRCSVTKFTLESEAPSTLTAASVIADMRNGIVAGNTASSEIEATNSNVDTAEDQNAGNMTTDELNMEGEPTNVDGKKRFGMLRYLSLKRN